MIRIGVLKEEAQNNISVLLPQNVKQLLDIKDVSVVVESGLGVAIGISDLEYQNAGAIVTDNSKELFQITDIILSFSRICNNEQPNERKTLIGFFDVLNDLSSVLTLKKNNIDVYSLGLLPRTTIAQSMDVLSSVASLVGYKAVLLASTVSNSTVPMMSGAGGTLRPAKIVVLGAGVAGLQAIATAKRLGAIVKAFDIRRVSKTDVTSLGAEFIEVEGAVDIESAGGYAIEQTKEYLDKVKEVLHREIVDADIVITTAKIPGKRAPLLIQEQTILTMKPGSIIVDLASETGGNSALTEKGKTIITSNDVTIIGTTDLLASIAKSASFTIANNFTSFLKHLLKNKTNEEDTILKATKVLSNGVVTNERLMQEIENL